MLGTPGDGLPLPKPLTMYWDMVTRALDGLGPEIDVKRFTRKHIEAVAPYILGIEVWTVIRPKDFYTWAEF